LHYGDISRKEKDPQSSSNNLLKRVIMFALLFPLIKNGVAYHTGIRKQNKIRKSQQEHGGYEEA